MTNSTRLQSAALSRSLAEMAEGGLASRIRLEQAARVVATARRAALLAGQGALFLPSLSDPSVQAVTESPITGGDGNVEFLLWAKNGAKNGARNGVVNAG